MYKILVLCSTCVKNFSLIMQSLMAAGDVLKLFDSYWFELEIFTNKVCISDPTTKPVLQNNRKLEKTELSRKPTLLGRFLSEQCLSSETSLSAGAPSSNLVIAIPKLQTLVSGVKVEEFPETVVKQGERENRIKKKLGEKRRRKRGAGSRSLTSLEFEELKGFMDLGFVFSEEDKDSSLVSIIPGLQKWGGRNTSGLITDDECSVPRPYLSESWSAVENSAKVINPLMNWKVPPLKNQIDMKNSLRTWAQTVAANVK